MIQEWHEIKPNVRQTDEGQTRSALARGIFPLNLASSLIKEEKTEESPKKFLLKPISIPPSSPPTLFLI